MNLFDTKIAYPQIFETLWKEYPLKVSKAEAYKAFKRLKIERSEELAPLIASIREHAKTDKWQRGIIPHLSTYINQRRWEDELGPVEVRRIAAKSNIDPLIEEAFRQRYDKEVLKKTLN